MKTALEHSSRVSIELSNRCPNARLHRKCPLNLMQKTPETLSAYMVNDVLDTLGRHCFEKRIALHSMSEPLADPRLFMFIERARKECPKADIYICTNGYFLTQAMVDELIIAGMTTLYISIYSKPEYERLSKLHIAVEHKLSRLGFDNRLDYYDVGQKGKGNNCCHGPRREIIVGRDGTVTACCIDWRHVHSFGNLHDEKIEEVGKVPALIKTHEAMMSHAKPMPLCKTCGRRKAP